MFSSLGALMTASSFSESCEVHVDQLCVCSGWSLSGKTPISHDLLVCHVPLAFSVLPPSDQDALHHLSLWWPCHLRCNLFLLFLLRIWSIDLRQMAGAEAIQSTRRLCRFNPWWVLIVKHSCDSSFCNGSVDIAKPLSSSIFRVWPLIFGATQMTSPPATWLTLLTSSTQVQLSYHHHIHHTPQRNADRVSPSFFVGWSSDSFQSGKRVGCGSVSHISGTFCC